MGLLELCLLSLVSPQEPAPVAAPPAPSVTIPAATTTTPTTPLVLPTQEPAPTTQPPGAGDDERMQLQAAEQAGAKADPQVLGQLTSSPNEKVASRASWLLGRLSGEKVVAVMNKVMSESPHAAARLQTMNALLRHASLASVPTAIAALEDTDIGVRTLAAQLLGKLRRPAALDPLLAVLERRTANTADGVKATDVQATLLALNDLGAGDHLLRIATALHERPAAGTGEALSYTFQNLSPKLDRKQEVSVLVAVLGHREPLLRRYAIGRLGTLAEPTTAAALEGRLGTEGAELRPLVEVALSQVRRDRTTEPNEGWLKVVETGKALVAKAKTRWDGLSEQGRWIVGSTPVALLLMLVVVGRMRRRRTAQASAAATMALVAPSEEHLQDLAAEAEALEEAAAAEAQAATATAEDAPAEEDDLVRN